jgi:hypothetical protein
LTGVPSNDHVGENPAAGSAALGSATVAENGIGTPHMPAPGALTETCGATFVTATSAVAATESVPSETITCTVERPGPSPTVSVAEEPSPVTSPLVADHE